MSTDASIPTPDQAANSSGENITPTVGRRLLLRGGAVAAGAAAVSVATNLGGIQTAQATDAGPVLIAKSNQGSKPTELTLDPASNSEPTLTLTNLKGPALRLTAVSAQALPNVRLQPGDIAGSQYGPLIGVPYDGGSDYLVTGRDLAMTPQMYPIDPLRLIDTRTAAGRTNIVRKSSPNALTSDGKLRGGEWIDVAVGQADDGYVISAAFANATAVRPDGDGFVAVYPATESRPGVSTLNFRTGTTVANAVTSGIGIFGQYFVLRIYTSTTTHILLDLNAVYAADAGDSTPRAQFADRHARKIARMKRQLAGGARQR